MYNYSVLKHKVFPLSQLPIEKVISPIISELKSNQTLILKAPPGAGKSTYLPLQLILQNAIQGKIIMLEPRRLAAKSIAYYLAEQLGEKIGKRVGYRIRGETNVGQNTKLEVVTEGILSRMIHADAELEGIGLIVFDEFHERSLHADTALAFCLDIQEVLRDDLKLLVMSATLDHTALKELLPDARYIESQGRSFPVEYRYSPIPKNQNLEDHVAKQVRWLLNNDQGSILVFLPGISSIKVVEQKLQYLDESIQVCPLHGGLDFHQQQMAITPSKEGQRKVVLATNIAETSLTIEGIRLVVDSGYERVAKFDLKSGITKLEQKKIAQSSAEQRAGRAGRMTAGVCVRLYSLEQLNQQPSRPKPEILTSELSNLVFDLAQWGVTNPEDLRWLDCPPESAIAQAKSLLVALGVIDLKGKLTELGNMVSRSGLEPRIGAMLSFDSDTRVTASLIAALLEEPEKNIDFSHSVSRFESDMHRKQKLVARRAEKIAQDLGCSFNMEQFEHRTVSLLLAIAFPDRIAQARVGQYGEFLLSNGQGVTISGEEKLAGSRYLVVLDLIRTTHQKTIVSSAIELDIDALQIFCPSLFAEDEVVFWNRNKGTLCAEVQLKCGRLIIERNSLPAPDRAKITQALLDLVQREGLSVLGWDTKSQDMLERVRCAQSWLPEEPWPDFSQQGLLDNIENWLSPYLTDIHTLSQLQSIDLYDVFNAFLGWPLNKMIDEWLPSHYQLATGSRIKIQYKEGSTPTLAVRIQEVFGEKSSPMIAKGKQALVLELLSPAGRPLQVTKDLASFWAGSYQDVQKEMKGRYPKHIWPDNPAEHVATTKTKRHFKS